MNTIVVVTQEAHIAQAMGDLITEVAAETGSDVVQVLPACSADDVLTILARGPIEMLIVDHHLAGTTGLDLIRWLGSGLTNTAKILLTDDSRLLADPWTFAGPSVNAVLSRPLGRHALKLTLERWLKSAARRQRQDQDRNGRRAEASQ